MGDGSQGLPTQYASVRALTERLVEPLPTEDLGLQSMPDCSPLKWHLAHTTWFFETLVLRPGLSGYGVFDPAFEYLFNSYYNAIGAQYPRPRRGLISRPTVEAVMDYRAHVDAALGEALSAGLPEALQRRVVLGLHHEQQHQELMVTDLKHALSFNPAGPAVTDWDDGPAADPGPPRFVAFEGGLVEIGAGGDGFHYDNEAPRHPVHLQPYELAERPVSEGEYQAFVEDGGYERPELWLSDGWAWLEQEGGLSGPLYHRRGEAAPEAYTLGGVRPLREDAPVCHLSFYEADAYARWAGARLPTEQEWEHAVASAGQAPPADADLLSPARLHPRPLAAGEGLRAYFGGVWEWTGSAYLPYPGFRPFEGEAAEYNGKFMSGQMVLRGGSCATPPGHLRASYRNFFPPSARWQFSGLRLARDGR